MPSTSTTLPQAAGSHSRNNAGPSIASTAAADDHPSPFGAFPSVPPLPVTLFRLQSRHRFSPRRSIACCRQASPRVANCAPSIFLRFARPLLSITSLSPQQGSTCAMAESMLRASGHTTGLFTSPHLVDVRERFRLNGEMVSVDTFLKHFWWCYDRCKEAASSPSSPIPMPAYFRFLTLLALRIFTHTQVDVAILEVGIGGRFDATNIAGAILFVRSSQAVFPFVSIPFFLLVFPLSYSILPQAGVPAVSAPQEEEAMEVLRLRAAELQIPLELARPWHEVAPGVRVGLAGRHQQVNASLAVSLCRQWAIRSGREKEADAIDQALADKTLPPAYIKGLGCASWPGRCEILQDCPTEPGQAGSAGGQLTFFLDGAHTVESMEVCGEWFSEASRDGGKDGEGDRRGAGERGGEGVGRTNTGEGAAATGAAGAEDTAAAAAGAQGSSQVEAKTPVRVLLFNCMPERDPHTLMAQLLRTLERKGLSLHRALFVPSLSSYTALLPSPTSSSPSSAYLPSSDSTGPAPNVTSQSTSSGTDASGTRQSSSLSQSSLVWQLAMQQTWEQLQQQPLHAVNFAAAAANIGAAPAAAPAPAPASAAASAAGSGARSVDSIPASFLVPCDSTHALVAAQYDGSEGGGDDNSGGGGGGGGYGGVKCDPSSLPDYDYSVKLNDRGLILHWKTVSSTTVNFAAQALAGPVADGWFAVGWSGSSGRMIPGEAVIGNLPGGTMNPYYLGYYSMAEVVPTINFSIGSAGNEAVLTKNADNSTIMKFSRSINDGTVKVLLKGVNYMIWAYSDGSQTLAQHPRSNMGSVQIDYSCPASGGSSSSGSSSQSQGSACQPSSLAGYKCSTQLSANAYILHWVVNKDSTLSMAAQVATTGYIGVGFSKDGKMTNSDAAIGNVPPGTLANGAAVGPYYMSGHELQSVTPTAMWSVTNTSVTTSNGYTIIKFTRTMGTGYVPINAFGPTTIIWAYSPDGSTTLADHRSNYTAAYIAHGALLSIAFALLMPLAILLARLLLADRPDGAPLNLNRASYIHADANGVAPSPQQQPAKNLRPMGFQLHRGIQVFALVVAVAGMIVIIVQAGSKGLSWTHGQVGLAAVILALVQAIVGFVRPDKTAPNRFMWLVAHCFIGATTIALAWAAMFLGIDLYHTKFMENVTWCYWVCGVCVGVFGVAYLVLVIPDSILSLKGRKDHGDDGKGTGTPAAF
ncbi:unnamed protein product [Closterium sp. NIES-54]